MMKPPSAMPRVCQLLLLALALHRAVAAPPLELSPYLEALLGPAELEVINLQAYFTPGVSAVRRPPGPYSPTFYQSLPEGLVADHLTAPGAPPVFAVIGDAMGVLGFQMCDIEHYMDHDNHTLPPCAPRAGWASKVAAAYGDKVWMVNHMIRSTNNAARVTLPLLFNQFNNETSHLRLVVLAFGSKYSGLQYNVTQHLAAMTESLKARGIRVVLMSRPPVNPAPPAPLFFNMYNTTTAATLADAVCTTAAETGVPCLDVHNLVLALGDRWTDALGPDGVHYSPLGQQLVYEGLMDLLATHYPDISPQRLLGSAVP